MNAHQKAELQKITQRALRNVMDSAKEHTPAQAEQSDLLNNMPVQISVCFGKAQMTLGELLTLKKGDIISLDKQAGDPIDIYVNDHLTAHGELTLSGEQFGVIITELVL